MRTLSRTPSRPERRTEENERDRIERLGRERPPQFSSLWAEVAFCYSVIMSQLMAEYFVSGFTVLVPAVIKKFDIQSSAATWPSAAFALVTSAFLLPCGRLADMFGGYSVYMFGLVWFTFWSFIAGFAQNELMLDCVRALQGIGPAAFLPSGVMLLGSTYRPGPRKNLVFSLYGASADLGFFFGVLMAGISGSYLDFRWYFWLGAIVLFTTFVAAFFTIPSDRHVQRSVKMDWLGSGLLVAGLVLTIFALTEGSHAPNQWTTWYILLTLILGIALLAATWYVEGYVASNPLLPFDLFTVPYIKPFFIGLFFSYGAFGVFLLYATLFMTDIMHADPILVSAYFTPMCIGGFILAVIGGHVLHVIPGTWLITISGCGWILASILFAVAPANANYWAYIFPSMLGATVGIDITFNVANVFISTSLSQRRQGLAGALMNTLIYLGIAFMLAIADVTQTETSSKVGLLKSYRAVFWFMLGCASLALGIMVVFVRIPKAAADLTVDEREALMQIAEASFLVYTTMATPSSPSTQHFTHQLTLSPQSSPPSLSLPLTLAYKTYGSSANAAHNAILLPTCYGGKLATTLPFLYDPAVTPSPVLSPEKYFIIVAGLLGGGESSSPSNAEAPYEGAEFPRVTYEDNIRLQHALCQSLGVEKLRGYVGFSMGGQQA
ncbi:MAG: hypothetical protein Q9159_001626 [Coniocarpon cinnabarinum]